MSDFGSWRQPPAIRRNMSAQVQAESDRIQMLPMTLEPTSEPVWPEQEALDEERLRASGRKVPALAPDPDAREIALHVRASLPDRLQGCVLKLPPGAPLPPAFDYYLVTVPATVAPTLSAVGITPRRLALELTLRDASGAEPPGVPVAWELYPATEVTTEIRHLGTFEIDLGKAVQAFQAIWPGLPDVLTARTGGSLDIKKVQAKVKANGKHQHACGWLISDTEIAYDFNPSCVVQAPKGTRLSVAARLHVEVEKRVAIVRHKTYLIQAKPMHYLLGSWVRPDSMRMGSTVTLNGPFQVDRNVLSREGPDGSYRVDLNALDQASRNAPDQAYQKATYEVSSNVSKEDPNKAREYIRTWYPDSRGPEAASGTAYVQGMADPPPGFQEFFATNVHYDSLTPQFVPGGELAPAPQDGGSRYAQVCRRGHVKAAALADPPSGQQGFCPECGAEVLGRCPSCGNPIPGAGRPPGVLVEFAEVQQYQPPMFCESCGGPFPWTTRPQRFYLLENLLDRADVGEATRLLVRDDLEALRTSAELDDARQLEIWRRIQARAPSLLSGPCLEVSRTLLTPYLEEGLGLAAGS